RTLKRRPYWRCFFWGAPASLAGLRHNVAIGAVPHLAPGKFGQGGAWKQGNLDGCETDPHPESRLPLGEVARNQKLVVAEAAVGHLDDVLGGAQFVSRV